MNTVTCIINKCGVFDQLMKIEHWYSSNTIAKVTTIVMEPAIHT